MGLPRMFDEPYVKVGSILVPRSIGGDLYLPAYGVAGTPADGQIPKWDAGDGFASWQDESGGAGALSDGDYGDIVVSGSGTVLTIDANVVSDAKLRQGTACTVIGRSANSTGNVADIALNADGKFLVRRSGVVQGDTIAAADVPSLDASKITTGTLALARGGTNADLSASGGTTKILAQDGSHVISARGLVAADIPSLAASILTSGQVAAARGGTGLDGSAAGNGKLLIGNGSGFALANLASADASVNISNGAGTIDLAVTTVPVSGLPSWVAYSADTKPASSQTEDDEFDSSSLNAKWTKTATLGSPTIDYDTTMRSHAMLKVTVTTGQQALWTQNGPATSAYTWAASFRLPWSGGSGNTVQLYIGDDTSRTNGVVISLNAAGVLNTQKRVTGTPTTLGTYALNLSPGFSSIILYIQKTSANNWRFAFSVDAGRAWTIVGTTSSAVTFTDTLIGFFLSCASTSVIGDRMGCDWARRDWITLI